MRYIEIMVWAQFSNGRYSVTLPKSELQDIFLRILLSTLSATCGIPRGKVCKRMQNHLCLQPPGDSHSHTSPQPTFSNIFKNFSWNFYMSLVSEKDKQMPGTCVSLQIPASTDFGLVIFTVISVFSHGFNRSQFLIYWSFFFFFVML